MSSSHALVLPSVEEGLALVQGQAMACGCPVIATDSTGAEDLFTDGVQGFIVPARDMTALTMRMQQLADDPRTPAQHEWPAALARVETLGGWDSLWRPVGVVVAQVSWLTGRAEAPLNRKARPTGRLFCLIEVIPV